jgi:hypothetical protein
MAHTTDPQKEPHLGLGSANKCEVPAVVGQGVVSPMPIGTQHAAVFIVSVFAMGIGLQS